MSSNTPAPDPDLGEALAGADFRRKVLERLVVMGMQVAEDMERRAAEGLEGRHCPGRAFAAASRAVRLTLAMHAMTESDILAMRKGVFSPPPFGQLVAPGAPAGPAVGRVRRLVRDAVREAIDREVGEAEVAREAREALNERLIDREDFDAFLDLPFRHCINAIRRDLGLEPDWDRSLATAGIVLPDQARRTREPAEDLATPDEPHGVRGTPPRSPEIPGLEAGAGSGPVLFSPSG